MKLQVVALSVKNQSNHPQSAIPLPILKSLCSLHMQRPGVSLPRLLLTIYSKSPTYEPSSCQRALYASYCTVPLYFSRYYKILNVLFFVSVMYYLCEKYYKPVRIQYYIASCVSWVSRLTSLNLKILSWNRTHSYLGDLLCSRLEA